MIIQEGVLADIVRGNLVLGSCSRSIGLLSNDWGGKCSQLLLSDLLQVAAACAIAGLQASTR